MNIVKAIERWAVQTPDAVAMEEAGTTVTYKNLFERSQQACQRLQELGVRKGDVVGFEADRGIETTILLIGLLMAGGAYTVVSNDQPEQRRQAMLRTLGTPIMLNTAAVASLPEPIMDCETVEREDDNLMYVIFTSGSTGTPKAVAVQDRAVLRFLNEPRLGLAPGKRLLHASTLEFDASVFELWVGLSYGATIVVARQQDILNPIALTQLLRSVDVAWLTSSLFNFIVDKDVNCLGSLERVIVGGEALSLNHVNRALPLTTVVNGYGPTENTVFTTLCEMTEPVEEISIGTPVAGTTVLVLDDDNKEAQEGELIAFGTGLSIGYLGDPDSTAKRFTMIDNRIGYHTGDRVSQRDGLLYFQGRTDNQVKIRGYRIQLEEVEEAFERSGSSVCKAFVTSGGELVAAVTAQPAHLKESVAAILPPYMRPRHIIEIDAIPLTRNGKADVRALEALLEADVSAETSSWAPDRSPELATIMNVISTVVPHARPKSGFSLFECGVDSIEIWRILQELNVRYKSSFTLLDVIDEPTVDAIEDLIKAHVSAQKKEN